MSNKRISFSVLGISALIFILTTVGCAGNVNLPTPSSIPVASASPTPVSIEATPTPAPVSNTNVLYQDDFTNPATGWPEEKFDNYFIGYHEPEYYHVEITGANYKTSVFEPEKQSFGDVTIEMKVLTVSAKTAAEGDFNYGIVFRRSGDQYYAFTISPRTKKWYVLKSSPNQLAILKEGTEESIHDLDVDDTLRVDAQGSDFFFHINDRPVDQVSDPDYASGEVGLYVQTFDSPGVHIHFDSLAIRDFEAPQPHNPGRLCSMRMISRIRPRVGRRRNLTIILLAIMNRNTIMLRSQVPITKPQCSNLKNRVLAMSPSR